MNKMDGLGIVKRVGWEDTEEGRQFTATILFPAEPPALPLSIVFDAVPVRIVPVIEAAEALSPEDKGTTR